MVNSSKDFIKSLNNFTSALESIVEVLYKQANSGEELSDIFKLSKEQSNSMNRMADALNVLTNDTKDLKNDNKKILQTLKSIQQKDNKGIFDRITNDNDKNKITSGVETIGLIAGGLLAIGLAFKVIGEVDPATILSVSISLPLIAYSFAKIAEIKNLTLENVTVVSAGIVIMSLGLALSSYILNKAPVISLNTFLSLLAVSSALTIMSYGYSNILQSLDGVSYSDLFKASISLPLMSMGIVLSAMVFGMIGSVNFDYLGIIMFAGTLALSATIMALPIWVLDKLGITPVKALEGSLSIVAISGGIMASSWLLALGTYTNSPDLDWTINTIAALGAFGLGTILLGTELEASGGLGLGAITLGVVGMGILAAGLIGIAAITSAGNFSGGPSLEWTQSLALWMLALVPATLLLGNPVSIIMADLAITTMSILAKGLVTIADIVKSGDFSGGPSKQWSEGIGLALVLFGNALNNLSPGLFSNESTDDKVSAMIKMASSLKQISLTIKGGDYKGGPSKEWSEGVGNALVLFGNALNNIKNEGFWSIFSNETSDDRVNALIKLSSSLKEISLAVKGGNYTGGPSEAWTKGSAQSILAFAQAMGFLQNSGIDSDDLEEWIAVSPLLGTGLAGVANSIAAGNYTIYPDAGWSDSIQSLFDIYIKSIDMKDQIEEGIDVFNDISKSIPRIANIMSKMNLALGGGQTLSSSINDIERLNNAYNNLSTSIVSLANSLSKLSINNMPAFNQLTNGLIALSIIDSDDLEDVLDLMNEKSEDVNELFKKISQSQNNESDELFNTNNSKVKGGLNTNILQQPQPSTVQQNPNVKVEKLLSEIYNVLNKIYSEVDGVNDKAPIITPGLNHK